MRFTLILYIRFGIPAAVTVTFKHDYISDRLLSEAAVRVLVCDIVDNKSIDCRHFQIGELCCSERENISYFFGANKMFSDLSMSMWLDQT